MRRFIYECCTESVIMFNQLRNSIQGIYCIEIDFTAEFFLSNSFDGVLCKKEKIKTKPHWSLEKKIILLQENKNKNGNK